MIYVGERFVIAGEGEETPADRLAIRLRPGAAWGFGWHPSTQAVLRAMETFAFDGQTVADVGSGTGILAIAAKLLGAGDVAAIEIKAERAELIAHNARLNNTRIRAVQRMGLDFDVDVVVANLGQTAPTLDALKHALRGFIITVDEIDVALVRASAEAAGFSVQDAETLSNVGPKPEPIPSNYISHLLVGSK